MSLRPLARSVSVIGVGNTQYGDPSTHPELKDMSLQDLGAWAARAAMEDAGIKASEIDKCILAMVNSAYFNAGNIAPIHGFLEFIGMQGKAGVFQNEACASSFCCLEEAVLEVASGRYDTIIVVDTEHSRWTADPKKPAHVLHPSTEQAKLFGRPFEGGLTAMDTAYGKHTGAVTSDVPARHFMKDSGITPDELEDALIGFAISSREQGKLNPVASQQTTWQEEAAKRGYEDVREYMKSKYNPRTTEYARVGYGIPFSGGACALIVCATDVAVAKNYKQAPIEVVNLSQCELSAIHPNLEYKMTKTAAKELYEVSGYKPEDIEYLATTDMSLAEAMASAVTVGYLPKEEAWKYFRDGKTKFDGDRPINVNGGHVSIGHAFSAAALSTVGEIVYQMRGQGGPRQIPNRPKVSLLRGTGSGQQVNMAIFRTVDEAFKEVPPTELGFKPIPMVKAFYDGLEEGKFYGVKCPECGHVNFPAYPTCNACGSIYGELFELSGDAVVNELYAVPSTFTFPSFAPYAPLFSGEVKLKEGPEFSALVFGITPETYEEMRDGGPFGVKLVAMPILGQDYCSFAVSYNGAVPTPDPTKTVSKDFERLMSARVEEITGDED